ncbi:MAG TPA: hypothetical protein VM123_18655 [archaeon]|nr:hypothetical protein [archaeon]
MLRKSRISLLCWGLLSTFALGATLSSPAGLDRAGASLAAGLGPLGLKPHEITAGFDNAAAGVSGSRESLGEVVDRCAEFENELSAIKRPGDYLAWSRKVLGLAEIRSPEPGSSGIRLALRKEIESLDSLMPGAGESLVDLVLADELLRSAFCLLTSAEKEELDSLVRGFKLQEDQWPDYPVERMLELAGRVDLASLWAAASEAERAASGLLVCGQVRVSQAGKQDPRPLLFLDTPWGAVIVGGGGPDTYRETPLLIVDLGGDDSYSLGSCSWRKVSMIVDLAGDDRYIAGHGYNLGGSLSGLSWIEDLQGNDSYEGEGACYTFGSAALGVGVLVDHAGNDSYLGGSFSQGASFFGLGMLADFSGDDSYRVSFCGQGASVGPGAGLLIDLEGDDSYAAGGLYPDWRETGATKSCAQGASLGLRPFVRGGTALLYDRSGRDRYKIDYFGQGAGYWGGTGILIDISGSDFYQAGRYGQGCGLHLATGVLADISGDDSYEIGGVGQGAGEDRAYGALLEGAGADLYQAGWMARGAGGTGGVGLLLELGGDDRYPESRKAADGFGSRWQELGSLGFLIDCGGNDLYGNIKKQGLIRRSGTWGGSVDLPVDPGN